MRIYVDFDDCLCETGRAFSTLAAEMFGRDVPYEGMRFFELDKTFDLDDAQFEQLMIRGHEPETLLSYKETPGASAVINEWIARGHEVSIMKAAHQAGDEMKRLHQYEGKIVRVIDVDGRAFTGIPVAFPAGYGLHEFNRDEESIKLNDYQLFESDIAEIRVLADFALLRATETWQRAGAWYVRIQAMAGEHHIPLRQAFDKHDTPDAKYIVVTDSDFPIATARMVPLDR